MKNSVGITTALVVYMSGVAHIGGILVGNRMGSRTVLDISEQILSVNRQ